jgi:tetratricopeptide (TPR) repeat protein
MLPWRGRRAKLFSSSALCLALLGCPFLGCHGRSEFCRGNELYGGGYYREAYRQFWEAYRLSPCQAYWDALSQAGRRVAEIERRQGLKAETAADWAAAREGYATALEYDPSWAELREDYLRVEDLIAARARLLEELEACRARGSSARPFEEAEQLFRLAASGHSFPSLKEELHEAIRASAEAAARPLRSATFGGPLPDGAEPLLELTRSWRAFLLDCELRVLEEENWLFCTIPAGKEAASWGLFRGTLNEPAEEARRALRILELAAEGVDLYWEGASLEKKGDLAGALQAYLDASLRHPFHAAAREGHRRALSRLTEDAYQASALAARQKEWREALDHLERLLRLSPGHTEGLQLRQLARDELSGRHALEAYRYEEAGYPANALVRYYLAMDLKPGDPSLKEAVRRLEDSISGRLRPRLKVALRAVDPEERRARRDLWAVEDEAILRLERELEDATQAHLDDLFDKQYGRGPQGSSVPGELTLLVEDLDFSYPEGDRVPGTRTARYVESFQVAPNPDCLRARTEAEAAAARLERAEIKARSPSPLEKSYLEEATNLERLKEKQARAFLSSLPGQVTDVSWGEISYPTVQVRRRIELAARYRFEGRSKWVSAVLEIGDQVVRSDPERNVPPDPEEFPSRAEALRVLALKLGEAVSLDAESFLSLRHEQFYREALQRLAAHSFDLAAENLVVFLYARRRQEDPLFDDAKRRLRELTRCDLPAHWPRGK